MCFKLLFLLVFSNFYLFSVGKYLQDCSPDFSLNCTLKYDRGTELIKCIDKNVFIAEAKVIHIEVRCFSTEAEIHFEFATGDLDPLDISNATLGYHGLELIFDASPIYTGQFKFWSLDKNASFYIFKEGIHPPYLLNNTRSISMKKTAEGYSLLPCRVWKHDAEVKLLKLVGNDFTPIEALYNPRDGFILPNASLSDVYECRTEIPNDFVIVKENGDWRSENCVQIVPQVNVNCTVEYLFIFYESLRNLKVNCWKPNVLFAWPEIDLIRINCTSQDPLHFHFDGILPQPNIDVRFSREFVNISDISTYSYSCYIEVAVGSSGMSTTGSYIIQSANLSTKFYIYREGHYPPYLFNYGKSLKTHDLVDNELTIPCRTWKSGARIKLLENNKELISAVYDPTIGFRVKYSNVNQNTTYKCTTGLPGDFVKYTYEKNSNDSRPPRMTLTFKDENIARCEGTAADSFGSPIKLFMYPLNSPTETKLLRPCVFQKNIEGCDKELVESYSLRCHAATGKICQELFVKASSGLIRCTCPRGQQTLVAEFFTGIDGHKYFTRSSLQFHPERMISLTLANSSVTSDKFVLYTNTSYSFKCSAVQYLFSDSLHVYLHSQGIFTLLSGATSGKNGVLTFLTDSYEFDEGTMEVICFGGIWNESTVVNSTKLLDIRERKMPIMLTKSNNYVFYIDDLHRTLECNAEGEPTPSLSWKKFEGEDLSKSTSMKSDGSLILQFAKIEKAHQGNYICVAENVVGNVSSEHKVTVKVKESISTHVIYIGASLGGICTILIVLLYVYFKYYLFQYNYLTDSEINLFLHGDPQIKTISAFANEYAESQAYDKDFDINRSFLEITEEVLGEGQFGIVYKGRFHSNFVAVKTVKTGVDKSYLKALLSELKIMIYLAKPSHPNIVNFIGAVTADLKIGKVYVLVEYCPLGNLLDHLRKIKNSKIAVQNKNVKRDQESMPKPKLVMPNYVQLDEICHYSCDNLVESQLRAALLNYSFQIVCGMEYLESRKVIHGDIAARNMLLYDNNSVKISDFGLSRQLYHYKEYVKKNVEPLPWRWMAIESLRQLSFSSLSDVWSFGITLWEIFSLGDVPYSGLNWTIGFVDELEGGLRLPITKYSSADIYGIMCACWQQNPQERPTFCSLKNFFNSMEQIS